MEDNSNRPEGRPLPRKRGQAAFSRSDTYGVPCTCGDWEFRDVTITTAIAALERWCPRCRCRMLLVFRRSGHVATVRLDGTQPRALRASLSDAGLGAGEVELLVQVAREMAS